MEKDKIITQISPLGFPWETQDPFLFCAYHRDEYPAGNGEGGVDSAAKQGRNIGRDFTVKDGWRMYHGQDIPGFPYHPHRGFETITINKEGVVDHSDSLGAAGRFMGGDVQWMTAGKGVQHSEMFPLIKNEEPNPLEIFQVWLNLPAKSKFVDPHFKMLWREAIPVVKTTTDEKTVEVDVIAGEYGERKAPQPTPDSWANDPENGVRVLTAKVEPGASWTIDPAKTEAQRNLYFYKGENIHIGAVEITTDHRVTLEGSVEVKVKNTSEKTAYFLLLEGKPIGEPVAQYGPFVMNTRAEIDQAIADYQRTEFGGWPWDEREKMHGTEKGRFALHADGTKEEKE